MARRNPNRPQLDFPELTADLIRELRLTGQLGLLDFADQVVPIFIVGTRGGALDVNLAASAFTSAEIFGGASVSPAAGTVLATTGALPAGDYDIFANISFAGSFGVLGSIELQHRDAADAATLATLLAVGVPGFNSQGQASLPLIGFTLALNERLRIITVTGALTGTAGGTMGARLRPTP